MSLELSNSYINPELSTCFNTTFDTLDICDSEQNISDINIMNINEANSSTPKVQFNIGDSANHPVTTITSLESEVDSGFISSEAVIIPEFNKGLVDIPNNVKFAAEDEIEEVSNYSFLIRY